MNGEARATPDAGDMVRLTISAADHAALRAAILRLRRSRGVVVRAADLLASLLGPMASVGLRRLNVPDVLLRKARALAEVALRRAFDLAVLGVRADTGGRRRFRLTDRLGQAVAATSGALSGLAGVAGFLPDVTLTTLLIMRRIASIAVEEGEDLSTEDARAACLQVFAFDEAASAQEGLRVEEADPELRYWTARFVLQGRPLVLLLSEVAGSYGVRISQKLALQAAPLVGAAGGAMVNGVFLDHYQSLARAHFVVRRLERVYGTDRVRAAWAEEA